MDRSTAARVTAGRLLALGCETVFGISYIFTKSAADTAGGFALLGWRFLIAAVIMSVCALLGIIKIELKGKDLRPLLRVALFCPCIYFIGETFGISRTSASVSGTFLASIPAVSLIFSSVLLKKKPTALQTAGILITLAGVLVTVYAADAAAGFSVSGCLFLAAGVISYSLYTVFVEKAEGFSGAEITYVMLLAGAAVFVTAAVADGLIHGELTRIAALPFTDRGFLTAVLYQAACCSVIAFFMSNAAIARIGVNGISAFIGVSTVVSILTGVLLLGEPFSAAQIVGAAVIIAGVYTANAGLKAE